MGDPIVSNDFVDLGTITSRSEAAGYTDDNVENYWHLKQRFRANDLTKNDRLLKCNFKAAKSVAAIALFDVNTDKVKFQLHSADAWGAPNHDSGELVVSRSQLTGRYNIIYTPPAVVTKQWMRVFIPSTASAVGSYTTKWEVGAMVVLDSYETIEKYGYSRTAVKAFEDISLPHGGVERISLGDEWRWEGTIDIPQRAEKDEDQYWTFNLFNPSEPMIFYENRGETQNVYLCLRDDAYEGNLVHHGVVTGNSIHMKELI